MRFLEGCSEATPKFAGLFGGREEIASNDGVVTSCSFPAFFDLFFFGVTSRFGRFHSLGAALHRTQTGFPKQYIAIQLTIH
jgi:hypothetical protein